MILNFYILATAFPLYVKDSLNGNQQQMGLTITIYVIGIVLFRPFSGLWVDRFGKKKMAIMGAVIFLLSSISYFGAQGIYLFLAVRFIHGMSYAIASTATSTVASTLIPNSRQGEGMGYFSMFMSIAMVIGPACGLYLWKDKNINLLLVTVSVLAALSLLFTMWIRVAQPKQSDTTMALNVEPVKGKKGLHWNDFIEPKALPISLVGFLLALSYSSLSGFMASYTTEIDQSQVAGIFFVAFAIMIVLFRPLVGKIFDKYNEHYVYYPGIVLFTVSMFLLSQANSGSTVLVAGFIMGAGYGALFSCFHALAIVLSPENRRGIANATFFLLFDFGYGVGSYFMGLIASFTNYRMMYFFAGVIALLSIGFYYGLHHRTRAKQSLQNDNVI